MGRHWTISSRKPDVHRIRLDIKVADGSEVTSILVLSGETKAEDIDTSDVKPDIVIEHIGELAKLL